MATKFQKIGVIGAGAWGTALALAAARAGRDVILWAREDEVVTSITEKRENSKFLAGVPIDAAITPTSDLDALGACEALIMVAPAQHVRTMSEQLAPVLSGRAIPVMIAAKGIEIATGKLLTEVLAETLPDAVPVILSGPTFAKEVAEGKPTAITLACADEALGQELIEAIGLPTFRPYYSDDIIGAQVGGAIKNVFAIACGIVDGRGLGDNARAALVARGMAEMARLGEELGGNRETLMGLSGLGDLILTCTSTQSRNYSLGVELGQGADIEQILASRHTVAEGYHTAKAVGAMVQQRGIDMPITMAVYHVVTGAESIDTAIGALLARPFTSE